MFGYETLSLVFDMLRQDWVGEEESQDRIRNETKSPLLKAGSLDNAFQDISLASPSWYIKQLENGLEISIMHAQKSRAHNLIVLV